MALLQPIKVQVMVSPNTEATVAAIETMVEIMGDKKNLPADIRLHAAELILRYSDCARPNDASKDHAD